MLMALLASSSLVLSGCGTLTGIPGHGGGKRFAEEQRLVSASIRGSLKQIDVSALRGKRVGLIFALIADEGGGNIVGGRASLAAILTGGTLVSPITTRENALEIYQVAGSGASVANTLSAGTGTNVSNVVMAGTNTGTNVTQTAGDTVSTNTSTQTNPGGTTTTTTTGQPTTTVTTGQPTTTVTTGNPTVTTSETPQVIVTGTNTGTSGTTTTTNGVTTTQNGTVSGTNTTTTPAVTTTTTTNPGSTTTTLTPGSNTTTTTPGAVTNTTVNPSVTVTSGGTTTTTNPNVTTTVNGTNTGTQDTTGSSTNTQTTNQTGTNTSQQEQVVETGFTEQTKGRQENISGSIRYDGLGTYQNLAVPKSDMSFLVQLVQNYLILNEVTPLAASDPAADYILYVTVDVLGTDRKRTDLVVYNNERLSAESAIEMFATDRRSGKVIMRPAVGNSRADYREDYLFWVGPLETKRKMEEGEGLLVDFSDQ